MPRCATSWRRESPRRRAIVAIVYADVPREVWPAAELTVRAQLAYLAER